MHTQEFIKIITEQADLLGLQVRHLAEEWAIELSSSEKKKFIVGYTFPLNNSACYKIVRNKNLCSEILNNLNIPNVPHHTIYSPRHLEKHHSLEGNIQLLESYIKLYNFPFLLKKNNTTKGDGVYLIQNRTQLEGCLANLYHTEAAFSLSPLRRNIREFRVIVLDGESLLIYEKKIPFLLGDGKRNFLELLVDYLQTNPQLKETPGKLFDTSLISKFTDIPENGQVLPLHWKHNRLRGSAYQIVTDPTLRKLAVDAAKAVDARFVAVDIIKSSGHGTEVLEINASVGIHFTFSEEHSKEYAIAGSIYKKAIEKTFGL